MYVDLKHVYLYCEVKRMEIKFNISSPGVLISIPLSGSEHLPESTQC